MAIVSYKIGRKIADPAYINNNKKNLDPSILRFLSLSRSPLIPHKPIYPSHPPASLRVSHRRRSSRLSSPPPPPVLLICLQSLLATAGLRISRRHRRAVAPRHRQSLPLSSL
ncbi:hypothetical protein ACOSQ4_024253 [Xanthoceras sorbifolium]